MRRLIFAGFVVFVMVYGCSKGELTEPGSGGAVDYPIELPPDTIENVYAFNGMFVKSFYDSGYVYFSAGLYPDSSFFVLYFDTLIVNDCTFVSFPFYSLRFPVEYIPDAMYRFEFIVHDPSNDIRYRLVFHEKTPDVDSFYISLPDSAYSTDTITVGLNLIGIPHVRDTFHIWVFGNSLYYCEDFKVPSTVSEFIYDLSRCAGQHSDVGSIQFFIIYGPIHYFPSLHDLGDGYPSYFMLGLHDSAGVFLKDRTR